MQAGDTHLQAGKEVVAHFEPEDRLLWAGATALAHAWLAVSWRRLACQEVCCWFCCCCCSYEVWKFAHSKLHGTDRQGAAQHAKSKPDRVLGKLNVSRYDNSVLQPCSQFIGQLLPHLLSPPPTPSNTVARRQSASASSFGSALASDPP